jgi:hypothetical protein
MFSSSDIDSVPEGATIFAATDILLGEDDEAKHGVLKGFLSGTGEFESTPCTFHSLVLLLIM